MHLTRVAGKVKIPPYKCSRHLEILSLLQEGLIFHVNHLLADNSYEALFSLCKQFEPRSGPTEHQSRSGFKLFDTLIVILKELFEKVFFEKIQQTTTEARKIIQNAKLGILDYFITFQLLTTMTDFIVPQWLSQNAENIMHIKGRLQDQAVVLLIASLFIMRTYLKEKNLLPQGANSFL